MFERGVESVLRENSMLAWPDLILGWNLEVWTWICSTTTVGLGTAGLAACLRAVWVFLRIFLKRTLVAAFIGILCC